MCRVEIHESYQFVSKSYHSMQYHFRSIDTWLNGICRRLELIAEPLNVSFSPIILWLSSAIAPRMSGRWHISSHRASTPYSQLSKMSLVERRTRREGEVGEMREGRRKVLRMTLCFNWQRDSISRLRRGRWWEKWSNFSTSQSPVPLSSGQGLGLIVSNICNQVSSPSVLQWVPVGSQPPIIQDLVHQLGDLPGLLLCVVEMQHLCKAFKTENFFKCKFAGYTIHTLGQTNLLYTLLQYFKCRLWEAHTCESFLLQYLHCWKKYFIFIFMACKNRISIVMQG